LWNSKESTESGDNKGHTRVQGAPEWKHLNLLGRLEVGQTIVWLARGMELLLKEGTAE